MKHNKKIIKQTAYKYATQTLTALGIAFSLTMPQKTEAKNTETTAAFKKHISAYTPAIIPFKDTTKIPVITTIKPITDTARLSFIQAWSKSYQTNTKQTLDFSKIQQIQGIKTASVVNSTKKTIGTTPVPATMQIQTITLRANNVPIVTIDGIWSNNEIDTIKQQWRDDQTLDLEGILSNEFTNDIIVPYGNNAEISIKRLDNWQQIIIKDANKNTMRIAGDLSTNNLSHLIKSAFEGRDICKNYPIQSLFTDIIEFEVTLYHDTIVKRASFSERKPALKDRHLYPDGILQPLKFSEYTADSAQAFYVGWNSGFDALKQSLEYIKQPASYNTPSPEGP